MYQVFMKRPQAIKLLVSQQLPNISDKELIDLLYEDMCSIDLSKISNFLNTREHESGRIGPNSLSIPK
ncbi:MAG: hypothetical protein MHPSP_000790, partial [Paramarteilia canceri]